MSWIPPRSCNDLEEAWLEKEQLSAIPINQSWHLQKIKNWGLSLKMKALGQAKAQRPQPLVVQTCTFILLWEFKRLAFMQAKTMAIMEQRRHWGKLQESTIAATVLINLKEHQRSNLAPLSWNPRQASAGETALRKGAHCTKGARILGSTTTIGRIPIHLLEMSHNHISFLKIKHLALKRSCLDRAPNIIRCVIEYLIPNWLT